MNGSVLVSLYFHAHSVNNFLMEYNFHQHYKKKYRINGKIFEDLPSVAKFYKVNIGVINNIMGTDAKIAPDGYPIYILWLKKKEKKVTLGADT